jgi:hypothetical protein
VYVTWAFCTWACQLCVYLCILDLAFDSLYEGTVLCLFECVLWWFFYLQRLIYLRDVSVTCVIFLCLVVFTWACPSVSFRLWIFSMGRICISILTQVTHVWLIFSFLVGRHFGLVGIEAFVEGLGLPLTWGMAVLDVLLLLFSVFFCKSNLHWFPYAIFKHVFALVIRFLCTFLCTSYALFVHFFLHFLCISFSLFMRFLCALKKRTKSVYTFFKKCMHFLCAFKSAKKKRA